jgi:hypothetical protein
MRMALLASSVAKYDQYLYVSMSYREIDGHSTARDLQANAILRVINVEYQLLFDIETFEVLQNL